MSKQRVTVKDRLAEAVVQVTQLTTQINTANRT